MLEGDKDLQYNVCMSTEEAAPPSSEAAVGQDEQGKWKMFFSGSNV